MAPLDADRTLALTYAPTAARAGVSALWHLDAALGAVVAGGKEPMLRQIKLVWWRDALERLGKGPAPAEPVLRSLAQHVIPSGVTGSELAAMYEGWVTLLHDEALGGNDLRSYAAARGRALFNLSGRLAGGELDEVQQMQGEAWALIDLARHSGEPDASAAFALAQERLPPATWAPKLRFIGMLAALARRDAAAKPGTFEVPGAPSRMWRMFRHRLTGH